jgi:hypothetical protein
MYYWLRLKTSQKTYQVKKNHIKNDYDIDFKLTLKYNIVHMHL